jgi:hypothetical protein
MKKLLFAAIALMVLAGSTFTTPTFKNDSNLAQVTKKKPAASPDDIPPPSCPVDDPNGCGIFG